LRNACRLIECKVFDRKAVLAISDREPASPLSLSVVLSKVIFDIVDVIQPSWFGVLILIALLVDLFNRQIGKDIERVVGIIVLRDAVNQTNEATVIAPLGPVLEFVKCCRPDDFPVDLDHVSAGALWYFGYRTNRAFEFERTDLDDRVPVKARGEDIDEP